LANRGDTYFFQLFRAYYAEYIPSQVMLYIWDETTVAERTTKREVIDL
jgi:hypothetical protein